MRDELAHLFYLIPLTSDTCLMSDTTHRRVYCLTRMFESNRVWWHLLWELYSHLVSPVHSVISRMTVIVQFLFLLFLTVSLIEADPGNEYIKVNSCNNIWLHYCRKFNIYIFYFLFLLFKASNVQGFVGNRRSDLVKL